MLFLKIKIFIVFSIIISGCGFSDSKFTETKKIENIIIETPNNKLNIILKKYLKRSFNNKPEIEAKFILKSNISITSNDALSSSGLNVLKSTKGKVEYSLINIKSGQIVKSGSIITFPVISSSSSSLYSNDVSLEHIKERLSLSSAKKLYMHLKLIMQKLN